MGCEAFIANLLQQSCISVVLLKKEVSAAAKVRSNMRYSPLVTLVLALTWRSPKLYTQLSRLSHGSSQYSHFLCGPSPPCYL